MQQEAAKDRLWELYNYSLVEWDEGAGRYRLHDLVRLFADSILSEEEREEAQREHSAHFMQVLAICQELFISGHEGGLSGLKLFDLERRNIEAGQNWASANWKSDAQATELAGKYPSIGIHVLTLRLHSKEQIKWLEKGLAAA